MTTEKSPGAQKRMSSDRGSPVSAAFLSLCALAGCANSQSLSNQSVWADLYAVSGSVRCYPDTSEPFVGADSVDVVVIGNVESVQVDAASKLDRAGVYKFAVEKVVRGQLSEGVLSLRFETSDSLGHVLGNDVPEARSIIYLQQTRSSGFKVIKDTLCNLTPNNR